MAFSICHKFEYICRETVITFVSRQAPSSVHRKTNLTTKYDVNKSYSLT